jgi:hypothetical protein
MSFPDQRTHDKNVWETVYSVFQMFWTRAYTSTHDRECVDLPVFKQDTKRGASNSVTVRPHPTIPYPTHRAKKQLPVLNNPTGAFHLRAMQSSKRLQGALHIIHPGTMRFDIWIRIGILIMSKVSSVRPFTCGLAPCCRQGARRQSYLCFRSECVQCIGTKLADGEPTQAGLIQHHCIKIRGQCAFGQTAP